MTADQADPSGPTDASEPLPGGTQPAVPTVADAGPGHAPGADRPDQLGSGLQAGRSGGVVGQPITLRAGAGHGPGGAPAPTAGTGDSGELFDRIGGAPTFDRLVRTFYEGVQTDPVIWPMYPADDLEGAISRLSLFLQQYWGGPTTYSQDRGHPRLRMRHMPFAVTPDARDRWLDHMRHAVESLELAPLDEATLWAYLDRAAHAMVNAFE